MKKCLFKSIFLSGILASFFSIVAVAQTLKLQGSICDVSKAPIVGAVVELVGGGANSLTISDVDGKFILENVPVNATVRISCLGMISQEIQLNGRTKLEVFLQEDSKLLEGVVVTALGIKRQEKALSYNVQQVKSDAITAVKDANFINSLNGKVAGVVINSSAAGAGSAARVVMRGTKSLEKDDNALYVVDGIPMFNINSGSSGGGTMSHQPGSSSSADINPEDVESMSILTGPSAAALYGSDAANGVVLITTKKGSQGKAKLTFSSNSTFSNPLLMPEFQNSYGNVIGQSVSWGKKLDTPSDFRPKDFFNTGYTGINSLTFTVGNAKNQTFASVASTNSTGILPNSNYNRYNLSIRNTSKFFKDAITLDLGAQYIYQNHKNLVGSGQYFNPLTSLYLFPRGEDFDEVRMFERYSAGRKIMLQYWPNSIFSPDLDMQNPYWIMYRMLHTQSKNRYVINAGLKWDVFEFLNVAARVRFDNSDYDSKNKYHASTNTVFTESSTKGLYKHSKQNDYSFYGDIIATFNKNFLDNKLSVNVNLGSSVNYQSEDSFYFGGGLKTYPNFFHLGNVDLSLSKLDEASWKDLTQSIFTSAEIGYGNYLFLSLTGRNDWSSRLAFTSKKSYFYPSVGLSFVLTELIKLPEPLSFVKMRASWAEVASAPGRYLTRMQYVYNNQTKKYEYPALHYNTDLKPENTRSWELGLNSKFFDNRLSFNLTWYRSNTYNQTFRVDASASSGYSANIVQTGNILNHGIELGLGYSDNIGPVKISANLNYTKNTNKIISLANGAINPETNEKIDMKYYPKGRLGISGGPEIRLTEGGTMGDLYINERLRQSPNGYIYVNDSKVEVESMPDYVKIGTILPKRHLGLSADVQWNGLTFGMVFSGRFGGIVVSDTQAIMDKYGVSKVTSDARDRGFVWVGEHKVDVKNYYENISKLPGTYYTYSATNFRLSELNLSYQLPKKWFKDLFAASFGVSGKNLWLIYCKAPFDPESTSAVSNNFYQGVDYFQQPSLRGFSFNVKLSF